MKKIIIVLAIFFLDRVTKIYLLNLQEDGTDIDFHITSFLNFYLIWNTGIGFGLASMDAKEELEQNLEVYKKKIQHWINM